MGAGLPNITGTYGKFKWGSIYGDTSSGCTYTSYVASDGYIINQDTGTQNGQIFNLNASRSSSLYGNSITVTPLSQKVTFLIHY